MKISKEEKINEETIRASISGRLMDIDNLAVFENFVDEKIKNGFKNFIFHFKKVSCISSTGLNRLVKIYIEIDKNGGKLVIYEPDIFVTRTLEITGLSKKVHVCDNLEEALTKV